MREQGRNYRGNRRFQIRHENVTKMQDRYDMSGEGGLKGLWETEVGIRDRSLKKSWGRHRRHPAVLKRSVK